MPQSKPIVLIVDDVNESASATQRLLDKNVASLVRSPGDVSDSDIKKAKLVLVDYRLDHWDELKEIATPSLRPQNGVALASVLRSNVEKLRAAPIAFALNSGVVNTLSGSRSSEDREHAIAKSLDIDWVFAKGTHPDSFGRSVYSLASAVAKMPNKWPQIQKSGVALTKLLNLPKRGSWSLQAIDHLDQAQAPQDILAETSRGMAVIRWLLHEILPYPTFLIDVRYLAARLNVDPGSLREVLEGPAGKRAASALGPFEYRGILNDFLGKRYWRAGIESWIWRETNGQPFDKASLTGLVRKRISGKLKSTSFAKAVVSLDNQFRPTDTLIELADAVQIAPDGWPLFADSAWVSINAAKDDPVLASLVSPNDRNRLT